MTEKKSISNEVDHWVRGIHWIDSLSLMRLLSTQGFSLKGYGDDCVPLASFVQITDHLHYHAKHLNAWYLNKSMPVMDAAFVAMWSKGLNVHHDKLIDKFRGIRDEANARTNVIVKDLQLPHLNKIHNLRIILGYESTQGK